MKNKNPLAAESLVLGAVSLAYEGTSYRKREELFPVGDVQAEVKSWKTIPLLRYLGFGLLAAGVVRLVKGNRAILGISSRANGTLSA